MKTTLLLAFAITGCATAADPAARYRVDVQQCFVAHDPDSCNSVSRAFGLGSERLHITEDFDLAQALARHACRLRPDVLPKDPMALVPLESRFEHHPECKQ